MRLTRALLPVVGFVLGFLAVVVLGTSITVPYDYASYLSNSAFLAVVTAAVCVVAGVAVANALRFSSGRLTRSAARLTIVGYAVPAPVVGIGVLLAIVGLDGLLDGVGIDVTLLLLSGSVAAGGLAVASMGSAPLALALAGVAVTAFLMGKKGVKAIQLNDKLQTEHGKLQKELDSGMLKNAEAQIGKLLKEDTELVADMVVYLLDKGRTGDELTRIAKTLGIEPRAFDTGQLKKRIG